MPKDPKLSAGKQSAETKGPKKLRKAARRAADTRAIRAAVTQARELLAENATKLELVQKLLDKIDSSAKPGKRAPKTR